MDFKAGDSRSISVPVTDELVRKFADVSGDYNPIHLDDKFAAQTRFGRRIAHGMICGSLISRALATELPGPGGLYLGQTLKFVSPVYINDTVTVKLTVSQVRADKGIYTIETLCSNQHGELVVKGEATIMRGDHLTQKD